MSTLPNVTVIGAGLAGAEAAWQLAQGGASVRLLEMKPLKRTAAQVSDFCAELVCSNSLRSANLNNAVGLLKEEMRRLGSLVIDCALRHRVAAGDALAVDRVAFGHAITEALQTHPRIERIAHVVDALPAAAEGHTIVATGPLTDDALAGQLAQVAGEHRLYFYDAIAPIVSADSIDGTIVFSASRYDKGDGADYLNCPLDEAQYDAFYAALQAAESMPLHAFEEPRFFQGCMPVEVVAQSGRDALRFGAMKPVGLRDPRTGKRPHAVVQLRREDANAQAYNLVGFQTKLKTADQRRVLRTIPGLQECEILRYGAIHRNTYLDSPALLDERMRLHTHPHLRFAGQITGVEGYVESAAHGMMTGLLLLSELIGRPWQVPPLTCALGALLGHVRGANRLPNRAHEPQNINWSLFAPPPVGMRKAQAKPYRVARAQEAFEAWSQACGLPVAPRLAMSVPHGSVSHAAVVGSVW